MIFAVHTVDCSHTILIHLLLLGYRYDILKDYPVQPLSDWCLQHPLYFFSSDSHNSPSNSPSSKKKRMSNGGKHGCDSLSRKSI